MASLSHPQADVRTDSSAQLGAMTTLTKNCATAYVRWLTELTCSWSYSGVLLVECRPCGAVESSMCRRWAPPDLVYL